MTRDDKHIAYRRYLEGKILEPKVTGFEVRTVDLVNEFPKAFNHQYDVVRWALQGGCRAIFCSFGLGKTVIQLMIAHMISQKTGKPFLIGLPLGVVQEFKEDATMLGLKVFYVKDQADAALYHAGRPGILLSNYERIREGKFNPDWFGGCSFDEGDAIRNLDTVTTDYIMNEFARIQYKFIATATPSPNDFTEILNYAQFLGIMDRSQALTRFFQRDSTSAGNLTLYPHKAREFWLWVRSWSITFEFPSEINPAYDDSNYTLPELKVIYHEVKVGDRGDIVDLDGNVQMFADSSRGLVESAKEKRDSIAHRLRRIEDILLSYIDGQATVSQGVLSKESNDSTGETAGTEQAQLPGQQGDEASQKSEVGGGEQGSNGGTPATTPRRRKKKGVQETTLRNEQGESSQADAGEQAQEGIRNNGSGLRSDVDGTEPQVSDLQFGRHAVGRGSLPQYREGQGTPLQEVQCGAGDIQGQSRFATEGHRLSQQVVIFCTLNKEQDLIVEALKDAGLTVASIDGSLPMEEKAELINGFKSRTYQILVSKPVILGSGVNLQYNSYIMIFAGVTFKFREFIQACHRIYRFRQSHEVEIHIIHTDAELHVLKSLQAKWSRHKELQAMMKELIKQYGLAHNAGDELRRSIGVKREVQEGESFKCILNDAVHEAIDMKDNSVGMGLTSIPFSDQYEYCELYNDMGHNDGNGEFWEQMDFLTPECYRVLQPGRIFCVHVKDRIRFSYQNGVGFTSLIDFSGQAVMHYEKHGFHLLGKHFITTDVVRENNQTYRLGWTENSKDGTKMGAGSPEYLLVFRKPPSDISNAYADVPVVKSKQDYTRGRWQLDAHAYWKSSGNRLLNSDELRKMDLSTIGKAWEVLDRSEVYNYEKHVAICETLDELGKLPSDFMAAPPHSHKDSVWDDVSRMHTLNSSQTRRRQEKHTCPLQFDIVDRCIVRYSNERDVVYDPFGGLMTVPYRCIELNRYGLATELNETSFKDGVKYCREAEYKRTVPTLFDLPEVKEVVNG